MPWGYVWLCFSARISGHRPSLPPSTHRTWHSIILTEMIKLAINLGLDTVCEGVEREDQLEFLQEMDKRYKEVRGDLYKAQSVIRMAQNYEQMARMLTRYVDRIKAMNGSQITYYQGRSMVYEGFQYLLFASREVKRAREYLDAKSQVSEEERIAQLAECDRRLSRANAALYNHIRDTYEDIDRGQRLAEAYESLEESFKINW